MFDLSFSVRFQTILIGLGSLAAVFSLREFFQGGKDLALVDAMEETPTTPISQVTPGGYFEVKGRAFAQHPLRVSRLAEELIFYRHVRREEYHYRDREGHSYREENVLECTEEAAPFLVQDSTGRLEVDPKGARLEGRLLFRFTEDLPDSGPGFVDMAMGETGRKRDRKVITEIFGSTSGSEIYVLGPTAPGATEPAMFRANQRESRPFLVSARSEEELGEIATDGGWVRTLVSGLVFLVALGCGYLLYTLPDAALQGEFHLDLDSLEDLKTVLGLFRH